jgi:hypothetical protein
MKPPPNEVTSAVGGWRVLFAFVAHSTAAAEFLRSPKMHCTAGRLVYLDADGPGS